MTCGGPAVTLESMQHHLCQACGLSHARPRVEAAANITAVRSAAMLASVWGRLDEAEGGGPPISLPFSP